jgi:two-component system, NarL family, nitrate/nitrite response regulator NarL
MRLVICDDHVVFAESLAHLLAVHGKQTAAITHSPDDLLEVLRRDPADVCLLDVWFGPRTSLDRLGELRATAPHTRFVILTAEIDRTVLAAARAAGIHGMVDKAQPLSEIIAVIDRVYAGEMVLRSGVLPVPAMTRTSRSQLNDAQRLALFLTPREKQVLTALVRGDDTRKLARSLGIATATARCHIQNVLIKLGAHSRLEAATSAVRYGVISAETGKWLTAGDDQVVAGHSPPSRKSW